MTRVISKKLRNSAKGQDCTLRLDGCCFDNETVVLAHLPTGQNGMGMKSPDNIAVFACHNCHQIIDGPERFNIPAKDYLRALSETQMVWIEAELIKINGMET